MKKIVILLLLIPLFNCSTRESVSYENYYVIAVKNGKWGILGLDNQWIVPNKYELVGRFSEGKAIVKRNGKYGFADTAGNETVPVIFESVMDFYHSMAPVKLNGEWGFINTTGKFMTEDKFDVIDEYHEGFWAVKKDGRWGFIDTAGHIISPKYKNVNSFSGGYAAVFTGETDTIAGLVDHNGKACFFDSLFCDIEPVYNQSAIATRKKGRRKILIDVNGNILFDVEKAGLAPCSGAPGYYYITAGDHPSEKGMINYKGQVILDTVFKKVFSPQNGYIPINQNGLWGFADTSGRIVVIPAFEDVHPFSENLAAFYDSPGYGFIDTQGKIIIQPAFDEVSFFRDGVARALSVNKYGAIDKQGKRVIPFIYENMSNATSNGFFLFSKANKWGVMDKTGKEIVQPLYDIPVMTVFRLDQNGNSVVD